MPEFGEDIKKDFLLDPDYVYLNHGSFGKVPKSVFEHRMRLSIDIETDVDKWLRQLQRLWDGNIAAAANFFHSDPDNLVFVQNASTGINSVLKSLGLHPGEAILMHSWQYNAVRMTGEMTCRLTGCELIVAEIKLPISNQQEIIDLYQETLKKHPNIKVAVLELICSPTAVLFPLKELAALCKKHGATVVVDGAHGPGQVPLDLEDLGSIGVDCFIGSLHKWCFVPCGCGILWIHPRLHSIIRPVVTSEIVDSEKPGPCFSYQGTRDDTPFYTVKKAIAFYEQIGGIEAAVRYNKDVVDKAVALLLKDWNTSKFPVPANMEAPCMRLVKMPRVRSLDLQEQNKVFAIATLWQATLQKRFNVIAFISFIHGEPFIRLSCNIYNTLDDFKKLAEAVKILVQEDVAEDK